MAKEKTSLAKEFDYCTFAQANGKKKVEMKDRPTIISTTKHQGPV